MGAVTRVVGRLLLGAIAQVAYAAYPQARLSPARASCPSWLPSLSNCSELQLFPLKGPFPVQQQEQQPWLRKQVLCPLNSLNHSHLEQHPLGISDTRQSTRSLFLFPPSSVVKIPRMLFQTYHS